MPWSFPTATSRGSCPGASLAFLASWNSVSSRNCDADYPASTGARTSTNPVNAGCGLAAAVAAGKSGATEGKNMAARRKKADETVVAEAEQAADSISQEVVTTGEPGDPDFCRITFSRVSVQFDLPKEDAKEILSDFRNLAAQASNGKPRLAITNA